jgi:hypothetical protein
VVLNATFPGETPDSWVIFATNLSDAAVTWQPGITCV